MWNNVPENHSTNRITHYLTSQVDFNARVDGSDLGVLHDLDRAVDLTDAVKLHTGVIMHKVIEATRAHAERGDDLVFVNCLVLALFLERERVKT